MENQYALGDSSRRTSMVFTIDQKDLYGQWNYEASLDSNKEPDSASTDEKPPKIEKNYFTTFIYVVLAAGAAVALYLLYRTYLYHAPTVDFAE